MAWTVAWEVWIDGVNVSNPMRPYLTDIQTVDKDGAASDKCSLTFDDKDGQIKLPSDGAAIKINLQGVQVFEGTVDKVNSNGSRGGGRLLKIGGKGFDSRGQVKEPQSFHKDDATLQDFLSQAAQQAGLDGIDVDPEFAEIERDYWAADNESFIHLGQRMARELHGTFKIRGNRAVLATRGDNELPAVTGIVTQNGGGNVITWNISPVTGRNVFTSAQVRYFDRAAAEFRTEDVEFEIDRDTPDAVNAIRSPAADQAQAREISEARKGEAKRQSGEGSVELDLAVEAQAEGKFILIGARPGIDGVYRMVTVKHKANRSGGATTSLDLKQPEGGAGKDSRS